VAISRARDRLYLARALRYGRQASRASSLLGLLPAALAGAAEGVTWPARPQHPEDARGPLWGSPLPETPPTFDVETLELYLRCPRRYYYDHVLGLHRHDDDAAYGQFHRCVHAVLSWLYEEVARGHAVDRAAAYARLAEVWEEDGPRDHLHEGFYRRQAEALLARALARPGPAYRRANGPPWEVALPHGRVLVQPDHLDVDGEGPAQSLVVRRLRTGSAGAAERDKGIYALYHAAAARAYPAARRQVQVVDLSTDEVADVPLSAAAVESRLGRYDAAIAGILGARYAPQPDDRQCPRCPHYFICPAAGAGG
jgi:hypothetical protein